MVNPLPVLPLPIFGFRGTISLRILQDIPRLLRDMEAKKLSPLAYSIATFPLYQSVLRSLGIDFTAIPDSVIERQYKAFIKMTENLLRTEDKIEEIDSMAFWAQVFDPKENLYEGLETVLHAAAVSAIKSSCESIVESFVSKYEYHANSRRNLNEDAVSDEFLIAQNGPVISKCDKVLEGALTGLYGDKKNWHFVR